MEMWNCSCGQNGNAGEFCPNCGVKRPARYHVKDGDMVYHESLENVFMSWIRSPYVVALVVTSVLSSVLWLISIVVLFGEFGLVPGVLTFIPIALAAAMSVALGYIVMTAYGNTSIVRIKGFENFNKLLLIFRRYTSISLFVYAMMCLLAILTLDYMHLESIFIIEACSIGWGIVVICYSRMIGEWVDNIRKKIQDAKSFSMETRHIATSCFAVAAVFIVLGFFFEPILDYTLDNLLYTPVGGLGELLDGFSAGASAYYEMTVLHGLQTVCTSVMFVLIGIIAYKYREVQSRMTALYMTTSGKKSYH